MVAHKCLFAHNSMPNFKYKKHTKYEMHRTINFSIVLNISSIKYSTQQTVIEYWKYKLMYESPTNSIEIHCVQYILHILIVQMQNRNKSIESMNFEFLSVSELRDTEVRRRDKVSIVQYNYRMQ